MEKKALRKERTKQYYICMVGCEQEGGEERFWEEEMNLLRSGNCRDCVEGELRLVIARMRSRKL